MSDVSEPTSTRKRGISLSDAVAGLGVTFVLLPQALAYAELAGMPPHHGLYAAALPAIVAAFFASSRYLQTGPTALTSLLTFGVLATFATPGEANYITLAGLLALIVGVVRIVLGVLRLGEIAYLMSEPVVMGFTSAAGVLILASQLPTVTGVSAPSGDVIAAALWTLSHPNEWSVIAILLGAGTLALMQLSVRIHPLFPGVLVAVVLGVVYSRFVGFDGPVLGAVPGGFPQVSFDFPWQALPQLFVAGTVIAIVGFAEAASISRNYATEDRDHWSPNREFVSQGMANVASALVNGFPVGGSFSRSAINRQAGSTSRWSGAITGVMVLAALPLVGWLEPLPRTILGAIIIGAVTSLIQPKPLLRLWRYSRPQFAVAVVTFGLSILLAPRVDWAIITGVMLALGVHLWREISLDLDSRYDPQTFTLHLTPRGVLWFASASKLEEDMLRVLADFPEAQTLVMHFEGLGRIDISGAFVLARFLGDTRDAGLKVELKDVPPQSRRFVEPLLEPERPKV
ncbi:MAG: SulP family inorganic anion transporter [Trueperaceae bacterium]|nr:SulP family inorganic anion transporter [Trueperaceae bacterium]